MRLAQTPSAQELRSRFERHSAFTVGVEEELLVCDPETLDLAPLAGELLRRLPQDRAFKGEMPAAQLELASPVAATVGEACAALLAARHEAADAAGGDAVLAAAGAHPFASGIGQLESGERYDAIQEEFAGVARRQLCFGLHVHVAVPGADRALAVFNALREHLPLLAALGANAPFYEGRDTGLASVRPKMCDLLPRQGVPPAVPSWEALADELAWGARSGVMADAAQWWWEARLHPRLGTVEVRVPDAQPTIGDAAALAAVVHCLVAWLAARADAGDLGEPAAGWRIGENRWSACRHGVTGRFADVRDGSARPTADVVRELLVDLAPFARDLGCSGELARAHHLVDHPPHERLRLAARDGGPRAAAAWLVRRFLTAD